MREESEAAYQQFRVQLSNFLTRVYYQLRNMGRTPQDRALNYAATHAFQATQICKEVIIDQYVLDTIKVVKSPICRPQSDCWDVQLQFFDPRKSIDSPST